MKPAGSENTILDQKDIKKTLVKVFKNWYWIVLFMSLSIGASMVYLKRSTKIYGANTRILVKPQKNAFKDALSESLPGAPPKEDINNEIEVLRSTRIIDETVKRLKLDVSYYIKGRLRTGEIYQNIPFTVVDAKILDETFYGIPFNIRIISKEMFNINLEYGDFRFNKTFHFGEPVVNSKFSLVINGNIDQISHNSKLGEINFLFMINNHSYLVSKFQSSLRMQKDENASVIDINVEDEVPDRAIAFLDTLTHLYIDYSIAVSKEINSNTIKFVDDQLQDVEGILNGVESNLEQYQRQTGTVNTGEQGSMYLQQKAETESELTKLTAKIGSVNYLYENLTSGGDVTTVAPALLADQDDPSLSTAFTELSTLYQKKTNLLFSNTPNSPVVKEVDDQISNARQRVIQLVLNLRRSLAVKYNSLSGQLGTYQSRISSMPSTIKGLVNINRKVEVNEKIYLFLLETRAQTVIARASIVPDKFVLNPSVSTGLLKPIKGKIMAMGAGIGLALSFLVIFLKGIFYNYIQNKDDLTELTTLPVIGVIGKSKEAKESYLVVDKNPQSLTAEAFRVIRTNLAYFAPKSASKVILITSSMASEGKTFCAINIASILAKAKKPVALIDLDLHKPKQANAFNLKNDVGVTSFLVGKASLNDIILETPVENLSVILTGPRTPNASELILDPMLEEMIQELKSRFEYIILDTPPVGLLSDALVMMKYSDLNLYVLKANYSKRDFVDIAHQIIEKNNIKSMSFILNNVNAKNIPAGYGGGYYK
ncbi:MAG TPA: polysaccharide biosynthesis tyrosine autokinase [Bacteroidia bacterium]|nr:polysaccharide biosynthesis tyrosine autokinase [Bacteroidia bacterium]